MSNEITWGDPIPVNGKRPEWLRDDEMCRPTWGDNEYDKGGTEPKYVHGWDICTFIRLPADHFAYKAIAAGFEPWGGGDEAPADWDWGEVMLRDGAETMPSWWSHNNSICDIIGYRKKPVAEPCDWSDIPGWALERERKLNALGDKCHAFARYIAEHEEPPVDPLAQEAERLCIEHYYSKIDTPENLALAALRRGIEIAEERRAGE